MTSTNINGRKPRYIQVLCFRNNDSVNRRLKLLPLDSPHFTVSGPRSAHKLRALKQTKVGVALAGLDRVPQSKDEANHQLGRSEHMS